VTAGVLEEIGKCAPTDKQGCMDRLAFQKQRNYSSGILAGMGAEVVSWSKSFALRCWSVLCFALQSSSRSSSQPEIRKEKDRHISVENEKGRNDRITYSCEKPNLCFWRNALSQSISYAWTTTKVVIILVSIACAYPCPRATARHLLLNKRRNRAELW
jgi:hypothetical protein